MYKASVMLVGMELQDDQMVHLSLAGYAEPKRIGETPDVQKMALTLDVPAEQANAMKIGQNFILHLALDPEG